MNLYKDCILITLEICIAIFIAIFGYSVWDNYNINNYYLAKENDNIKEVQIDIKDNTLYTHNMSKNNNKISLILKIEKSEFDKNKDIELIVDDYNINLHNKIKKSDNKYYYFNIKDINYNSFETKKNKFEIRNADLLNYEFLTEL